MMQRAAARASTTTTLSLTRTQRLVARACACSSSAHTQDGAWPRALTPELAHTLLQRGYAVVHNALPPSYLHAIKREMETLRAAGQLYPNATHILLQGETQPTLLHKHHIVETELALERVRSQAPVLKRFFEDEVVFAPLAQALPPWLDLSGAMVKLQYNEGDGGCFPLHFDTYGDDGKCVTAVLYLNDDWHDGDGGEIVLYPFPSEAPVVVAPRFGDMVLFSSQQMLHRVLPSHKPRYCLTTWVYQSTPDAAARAAYYREAAARDERPEPMDRDAVAFRSMMEKVLASPFRRHLQKLFYADEWTRSLHEAHLPTPAFAAYMQTHEQELCVIARATEQMLQNFRAKDAAQPSTLPATCEELAARLVPSAKTTSMTQLPWF